jgi:hypothetical protein
MFIGGKLGEVGDCRSPKYLGGKRLELLTPFGVKGKVETNKIIITFIMLFV